MADPHFGDFWNKCSLFERIPIIVQDEYEFTCYRLLQRIEKIFFTVQLEKSNVESINNELDNQLSVFNEVSNQLVSKIESLISLSKTHYCINNNLKDFVEYISSLWHQVKKEEYSNYYRYRISSRTVPGFPLMKFMRKIQIDADEIQMMLQFSACDCNQQCVERGFYICDEISRVIENTAACDHKVQLLKTIPEITPFVNNLISSIDNFVNNNEIIPLNRSCDELSVFPLVSKLLTGELFGYEPIDSQFVLKTNAPKKPIFITKVIQRKINIPSITCEC